MNDRERSMAVIERIIRICADDLERLAREGYADKGRGIVIYSVQGQEVTELYVDQEAWEDDPLDDDPKILTWIATYNPARTYIAVICEAPPGQKNGGMQTRVLAYRRPTTPAA